MSATAQSKMINGRVGEHEANTAARVLKRQGLTVSAFIRNSIEHIARTGEVPECGFPARRDVAGQEMLREFVKAIESKPMPGRCDFADVDEDDLVDELRLERYDY